MKPAEQPMTPFELARVDAHIFQMENFQHLAPSAKIEILKSLAKDAIRLYAEVLRYRKTDAAREHPIDKIVGEILSGEGPT